MIGTRTAALVGAMVLALSAATASAQTPPSARDPLTACVVAHTADADRTVLVRWVFAMITASPKVADLSGLTPAQRDGFSKQTGALMTRLLTADCRPEAVAAIKAKGDGAIKDSFRVLGETAMTGLMQDPAVAKAMLGIMAGADMRALGELMIDGGVQPKAAK